MILISPWVDYFFTGGSMITNSLYDILPDIFHNVARYYMPNDSIDNISPIFQDYSYNITTKILIEYGNKEIFYDQINNFIIKIKNDNNNIKIKIKLYNNMIHVFQLLFQSKQKECYESLQNINNFINE